MLKAQITKRRWSLCSCENLKLFFFDFLIILSFSTLLTINNPLLSVSKTGWDKSLKYSLIQDTSYLTCLKDIFKVSETSFIVMFGSDRIISAICFILEVIFFTII